MSSAPAGLRPAEAPDAAAIAGLVERCFEEYREFAPAGWEPPSQVGAAERIEASLARPEGGGAVAVAMEAHAGHVLWIPATSAMRYESDDPTVAYLWQLFVAPAHRGSGLATRLLDWVVGSTRALAFREIRLLTPRNHERARAFYEREGWSSLGDWGVDPDLNLPLLEYGRRL
jgi:GNAT superfamily N-acetyltransferase